MPAATVLVGLFSFPLEREELDFLMSKVSIVGRITRRASLSRPDGCGWPMQTYWHGPHSFGRLVRSRGGRATATADAHPYDAVAFLYTERGRP